MSMTVDLWDVLQTLIFAAISVVGWGVRLIWTEIRTQREAMREYVRQESCRMHREQIQQQIEAMKRNA